MTAHDFQTLAIVCTTELAERLSEMQYILDFEAETEEEYLAFEAEADEYDLEQNWGAICALRTRIDAYGYQPLMLDDLDKAGARLAQSLPAWHWRGPEAGVPHEANWWRVR
jgi:hypothetical protein